MCFLCYNEKTTLDMPDAIDHHVLESMPTVGEDLKAIFADLFDLEREHERIDDYYKSKPRSGYSGKL